MYVAYFINIETGEMMRTSQPSDNPSGKEWERITDEQYRKYLTAIQYAVYQADDCK